MKLLVASSIRFWRRRIGSQVRTERMLRHLAENGCEMTVLFVGKLYAEDWKLIAEADPPLRVFNHETGFGQWRYRRSLARALKEAVPLRAKEVLKRAFRRLAGNATHRADDENESTRFGEPALADMARPEYVELFREVCRDVRPDAVIVETVRLAYLLEATRDALPSHAVTLIDTHDVLHERAERFHQRGEQHDFAISAQEEAAALSLCDHVLAIQQVDARKFRELLPHRSVVVVSHPHAVVKLPWTRSHATRLLYVGSGMAPNVQAMEKFLVEIWPPLRARFGDRITLTVHGTICESFSTLPPIRGVRFGGFAPDLEVAYRDADVVINPVEFGGGLKIKTVEALCYARPLVTTPIGAEGLEQGAGHAFIVYETSEQAVRAIADLVEQPRLREEYSAKAYEFASRAFMEDDIYAALDDILKVGARRPA